MRFSKYAPAAEEVFEQGGYPDMERDPEGYIAWWDEQIRRCLYGYKTSNGDYITGAYYFHLNFNRILRYDSVTNDKIFLPPLYRDLDHEYYNMLDWCEKNHWGIFTLKARRKAFSTNTSSFLYHRWSFYPGTEIGVGAFEDEDVNKIRLLIGDIRSVLPPELVHAATDNKDILEAQIKIKGDTGWKNDGTKSRMYFRCFGGAKGKVGAFRGLSLKIHDFEEVGKNPQLLKCIAASRECWMEGSLMYGLPILGGTGDKMTNMSTDLEDIWDNAESFRLKQFFIPASKGYYPFFNEKTGKSDMVAAEADVKAKLAEKYKKENKTDFYSFLQENALKPEDSFMGNSMNATLPIDLVNHQIINLKDKESLTNRLMRGNMYWEHGRYDPINPRVIWEPAEDDGKWLIYKMPENEKYRNLDIGGVDTYFTSGATQSESKGCMFIYRRYNPFNSEMEQELPICMYLAKEKTTEEFYDNCLKTAVFYKAKMLVEYDEAFGNWIKQANAYKWMKERPVAADSEWSDVSNKFMIHMKVHQKELLTRLLIDYIHKHSNNIMFLQLLEDFKKYGRSNTDMAMAFGICLIHDLDNSALMVTDNTKAEVEKDFLPRYERTASGLIKQVYYQDEGRPTLDFSKPF